MKERFEGTENPNLLDALKRQELIGGDLSIAGAFAKHGEVLEFQKNDKLIVENAEDTDIYLLLAGAVAIVVKGNHVRTRSAGQHVGDMAAIEPSQKRSATVVACDTVVALKVSSVDFMSVGREHPEIWLPIARELARRLLQRNDLIKPPNAHPKLFIISSTEALTVANEVHSQLQPDVFSTVWSEGVFFADPTPTFDS